jgi:hypothetical protein
LIYQRGQVPGTVSGQSDLGDKIIVNGIAVIPRTGSGDSVFKEISATHLDTNKLAITLC